MVTFCPSTIPYSAKPLRKASTKCALSRADRALRNPIIGLFVGCEFAASGGQTTEPAIALINSRRLIVAPEAQTRHRSNPHCCSGRGQVNRRRPLWVRSRHMQCKTACPLYPRKRTLERSGAVGEQRNRAWQNHPDFGEFAGLCIDLDRTTVLLDNNVVADRQPQSGPFSGGLRCKKRIKDLFPHIRRNAGAIVPDCYFDTVT